MLIKENSSILIPIDFSKQSLIAIEQSYNLAKFTKSKIILMHASPNSNVDHQKDLEEMVDKPR
jgi:microsomal dipeptidase-like Zn-dependent dipeptidase